MGSGGPRSSRALACEYSGLGSIPLRTLTMKIGGFALNWKKNRTQNPVPSTLDFDLFRASPKVLKLEY